jgi:glycosyltransferase involved in cell wall biosynthesis
MLPVAVDGRTLQGLTFGGVGRALSQQLRLLQAEAEITLLLDGRLGADMNPRAPTGLATHRLRAPLRGGVAWLQLAVPPWLGRFRGGVFHTPFYGLPYRQPVPMVVTMHDLTFETNPEWFSTASRQAFRLQARHAARTAARILTVSDHVRQQVISRYGVDGDRVLVVPNAVDPLFSAGGPAGGGELRQAMGMDRPYVVALGGAPRRNLAGAVAAWREARRRGLTHELVLVRAGEVAREKGLRALGDLDDTAWAAVLAGADALLYPTLHEGFGMPALEAAASGVPVVCARVGALPEVLGSAAMWADSTNPGVLAERLVELLSDATLHAGLVRAGLQRVAASPGWGVAAATQLRAYREAAKSA